MKHIPMSCQIFSRLFFIFKCILSFLLNKKKNPLILRRLLMRREKKQNSVCEIKKRDKIWCQIFLQLQFQTPEHLGTQSSKHFK